MNEIPECGGVVWRDGKVVPQIKPPKPTPEQIFKEQNMRSHPSHCPPILHTDCRNIVNDALRYKKAVTNQEMHVHSDSDVASALASFAGGMNIAAYVSCAIRDAGSEVAGSLDRLARALENMTPTVEPPTLVRLRDVARRIGLTSDAIMRMSLKGDFPKSIRLDGIPFFREVDIDAWLTAKAA